MPPSNKRKAQTEASEVVEQIKANGAFTRHTTPGISSYNMYALPDAAVYEFLENDWHVTHSNGWRNQVVQDERDCIKRFVRREDDILEEDEDGNMVEVIKAIDSWSPRHTPIRAISLNPLTWNGSGNRWQMNPVVW